MEAQVPAYACRCRGDAPSWRKVLSMAGFGNAGLPPRVIANAEEAEKAFATRCPVPPRASPSHDLRACQSGDQVQQLEHVDRAATDALEFAS